MLHLELKNTVSGNSFEMPCATGKLPEFLAMSTGSHTDSHGVTWNVTASTTGGNIRRYVTASGISGTVNAQTIESALEEIGFGAIENLGIIMSDYVPFECHAIEPDQETTYPYYYAWAKAMPDSGNMTNIVQDTISFRTSAQTHNMGQTNYTNPNGTLKGYGGGIALINTLGVYIYGAFYIGVSYQNATGKSGVTVDFNFNTSVTSENWTIPEYDPGDKGFRPTGAPTKKTRPGIGGRPSGGHGKDPEYRSDPITQPGEPDESGASASGSGFLTAYEMSSGNLAGVGACLFGSTLEGKLSGIFVNPLDWLVSLNVFPAKPTAGGSYPVKLGRFKCVNDISDPDALGVDAYGAKLTKQFKVFDFGTLSVPENWGNFLDYEGTQIDLYLPFIGTVSIDPSELLGGTINVQYTIDFFTGMCVANVLCTKNMELPSGQALANICAQHSYQGNCATQIPLTRVDYGSMIGNLINSCTQAITNPTGALVNMTEGAVNGAFRPSVTSKGNIVANSGYCSVLYPYLRITRPITAEPESFQEVIGYPSYINTTLGECSGICVCEDIDLKGITGATEGELNKIKQACREGVYI